MLDFLEEYSLLCPHQSGFRSSDSCQSQLLSIVHDIYASFDQSPTLEVRANFLDISKAFDKVWHEGLIFKLEHIGISGNLLSLLKSFLNNRFQRVVLNDQCSNWSSVLAGVPQGSIIGALLFLIIFLRVYTLPLNSLQMTHHCFQLFMTPICPLTN